jgi:circadian clock protein KaiC
MRKPIVAHRKDGAVPVLNSLPKTPTGVSGLDEITVGGLPKGRTTLVCGGAGCGKTLLGMEFLVRGATQFGEAGVCISFEETPEELASNVASIGFDVRALVAEKKLVIDYVLLDRGQVEETGEYDLEGLFVRLAHAVDTIGAKRVVLDSLESLFAGLPNEAILRSEMRRLFRWLKDRGLTTIVTAEKGVGTLTRHGLEEYISDCVIVLDHRVQEEIFTRRLRVMKYRGSTHGTNDYPFLIDRDGISIMPVTSAALQHTASTERISAGVPALDEMLGGKGYYRGGTVLVSGSAGTGKTSLAAHFLDAACARGEPCVFFAFQESESQVARNMRSIGIDLEPWIAKGLLRFHAERPTAVGLEMHLVRMHRVLAQFRPRLVVLDPVTALAQGGSLSETQTMLLRLVDMLKAQRITAMMTTLTQGDDAQGQSAAHISSLVDCWLHLQNIETNGERNRVLNVLKARGLAHSNQVREFLLTARGVQLQQAYLGEAGVLTGSARRAQEARDASVDLLMQQELDRRQLAFERQHKALEAQIDALRLELATEEQEWRQFSRQSAAQLRQKGEDRELMVRSRSADASAAGGKAKRDKGAKV